MSHPWRAIVPPVTTGHILIFAVLYLICDQFICGFFFQEGKWINLLQKVSFLALSFKLRSYTKVNAWFLKHLKSSRPTRDNDFGISQQPNGSS